MTYIYIVAGTRVTYNDCFNRINLKSPINYNEGLRTKIEGILFEQVEWVERGNHSVGLKLLAVYTAGVGNNSGERETYSMMKTHNRVNSLIMPTSTEWNNSDIKPLCRGPPATPSRTPGPQFGKHLSKAVVSPSRYDIRWLKSVSGNIKSAHRSAQAHLLHMSSPQF